MISLSDLKTYAEKLPQRCDDGGHHRLAIMPKMSPYYDPQPRLCPEYHLQGQTIVFQARRAKVHGVDVTAWFYHDVLVKVGV